MPEVELASEGLATIGEAADFLGLSKWSVYQLFKSGDLSYCYLARRRRVPWRALRDFAQKCVETRVQGNAIAG